MSSTHRGTSGWNRREFLHLAAASAVLAGCGTGNNHAGTAQPARPKTPGPRALADKPNIVVLLADSLRAREMSAYGCEWATTPVLDDLARQGILYERCASPSSWTKPSVGTIFTGLVPSVHQAILNTFGVPLAERRSEGLRESFTTMAESLQMAGYHTYWSLENPLVQRHLGYGQGFATQDYGWPPDPVAQTQRVIDWIRGGLPQPFFLFVHEMDPHVPYLPEARLLDQLFGATRADILAGIDPKQADLIDAFDFHLRRMQLQPELYLNEVRPDLENRIDAEGAAAWRRLYAAETLGVDELFGQIIETLDTQRLLDTTHVIITSDHGEAFREHGNIMHGHTLYEEEVHVPLIVRPPGGAGGIRVPDPVSLADLYPTAATVAGAPMPPYLHGTSLLDGDGAVLDAAGRTVITETNRFSDNPDDWHVTATRGTTKVYVHDRGARVEVFDLKDDPGEQRDLAPAGGTPAARALLADLEAAQEEHRRFAEAIGPAPWIRWQDTADEERVFEDIESVGYL